MSLVLDKRLFQEKTDAIDGKRGCEAAKKDLPKYYVNSSLLNRFWQYD
jgi:hypothetical protein